MFQWDLAHRAGLGIDAEGVIDLRDQQISSVFDTYLNEWTRFAPMDELRQLAALALRIAPLYRASTWLEVLRNAPSAIDKHGATPRA